MGIVHINGCTTKHSYLGELDRLEKGGELDRTIWFEQIPEYI